MSTATIHIEGWSSYCGACGGNASYRDAAHIKGGPNRNSYAEGSDSTLDQENGCGAVFIDKDGEGAHVVRPDLPFSPDRIARNKQAFDEARRCTVVRSDGTVEHDWERMRDTHTGESVLVQKWSDAHGAYISKFPSKVLFDHWQDGGTAKSGEEMANMCRVPKQIIDQWNEEQE